MTSAILSGGELTNRLKTSNPERKSTHCYDFFLNSFLVELIFYAKKKGVKIFFLLYKFTEIFPSLEKKNLRVTFFVVFYNERRKRLKKTNVKWYNMMEMLEKVNSHIPVVHKCL